MTARFFGYGSLVNLATHDFAAPIPDHLEGWRRIWQPTTLRPVAFLSVEPSRGSLIEGVTAGVPGNDWRALDAREYAYEKHSVETVAGERVQVYQVAAGYCAARSGGHPILRSYLDTVAAGFFQQSGEQGVAQFFATTTGWDLPILDDRGAPRYPRAQQAGAQVTVLVDQLLDALGVL